MLITLASFMLLGYLAIAATLYIFQPRFVYYPARELDTSPQSIGLDFESVHIHTADGIRLHAWLVPARPARGHVLFLHGNAGNISHRIQTLRIFNQLGLTTLIIDYRGYGLSDGEPTESGTYQDAEAAWRFLTEQRGVSAEDIVVIGRSLGGAVAIWLATQHRAAGLVVESSFTSVAELSKRFYPYLPTSLLVRIRYPSLARIKQLECPVLIVHSPEDDIVPYAHGKRLFQAAREPKRFVSISGEHNYGFLQDERRYVAGLDGFITTLLGP